jgi:hypothetical protein
LTCLKCHAQANLPGQGLQNQKQGALALEAPALWDLMPMPCLKTRFLQKQAAEEANLDLQRLG